MTLSQIDLVLRTAGIAVLLLMALLLARDALAQLAGWLLALFAVATMAGAHFALGAIAGGMMIVLFPELLRRLNLPQDVGNVFFALGAVQALSTGETIAETWMRLARKLRPTRAVEAATAAGSLPDKTSHPAGIAL